MTLFGTAQELTRQLFEEQEKLTIRNYTRTARKPGVRKEMLAGLPKIVEEYDIPAEDECSRCGECGTDKSEHPKDRRHQLSSIT